jgi:hypothetical protein
MISGEILEVIAASAAKSVLLSRSSAVVANPRLKVANVSVHMRVCGLTSKYSLGGIFQ